MLLLLDNLDSFTFNLAHYFEALGQQVIVKRIDSCEFEQVIALTPDYLVISPGPGKPADAVLAKQLIQFFTGKIPILGVCLGHQCIIELFGGQVVRAAAILHGKTSLVSHDNSNIFYDCPQPMRVTRYHSLIADADSMPSCLMVTATVAGDASSIMAVQHQTLPIFGVQFHPESVLTEGGYHLLGNFLKVSLNMVKNKFKHHLYLCD